MPKKKAVPEFKSEAEELAFWDEHDPEEFDDGPADEIIMAIKMTESRHGARPGSGTRTREPRPLHVVPRDGGWAVIREGGSRALCRHSTQQEALVAAREAAMKERGQLIVHRADGTIREERTYRRAPCPPRG